MNERIIFGNFENPQVRQLGEKFNPFRGMPWLNPSEDTSVIGTSVPFHLEGVGHTVLEVFELWPNLKRSEVVLIDIVEGQVKKRPLKSALGGIQAKIYNPDAQGGDIFAHPHLTGYMQIGGMYISTYSDWFKSWEMGLEQGDYEPPILEFLLSQMFMGEPMDNDSNTVESDDCSHWEQPGSFVTDTSIENLSKPEFFFDDASLEDLLIIEV